VNAIQHSLTEQVFAVKQTPRLGEAEISSKKDETVGGFSQNENRQRENTFTSAFSQERRAVRPEDKAMNRSEGEKAGEAVGIKKPVTITKPAQSTSSKANVETEGNLSSEEEQEALDATEKGESFLTPELIALIKSGMDSAANPLTAVSQPRFGEHLLKEISQEGTDNGRKLALTLSAWIQLNEGKSDIPSPEDLQSSLADLFRNLDNATANGEENEIASLALLNADFGSSGFEDNRETLSPLISSKRLDGNTSVAEETLSQAESGSLSSLSRSDAIETGESATQNLAPTDGIDAGTKPVELAVNFLTADVRPDTLPEETPNSGNGFDLSAEKRSENPEPFPKELGFFDSEGVELRKEPASSQTQMSTAGIAHPTEQAQEGATSSQKGEEPVPIEGHLTDGDNRQKSVIDQPLPGLKDFPSNVKETGAQPEKTDYPTHTKPSEEGTQQQADLADTSGFQRKTVKVVQLPGTPNVTVKQANQPTLWDRYQGMYFEKDIQKVKLDAFTVKVFQKPAQASDIPFDSAKPLERREGQQLTNGLKSIENPVFRMVTPIKTNVYRDIGTVRGQDIQTALSGIEGPKGNRLQVSETAEGSAVKLPQSAEETTKPSPFAQPFSKESGTKEEKGDSQAMNQQSESGWKTQALTEKEAPNSKDTEINIREIAQRIKDLAALSASRSRTVESAVIRLNPPELGRMVLEVVKEGNSIVVLMKVETQEAKEMLEKNAHLLTQRLAQTGFESQKVQVMMEKYEEQGQGRQEAQQEKGSDQEKRQKENEKTKENDTDEPVYQSFAELLAGI